MVSCATPQIFLRRRFSLCCCGRLGWKSRELSPAIVAAVPRVILSSYTRCDKSACYWDTVCDVWRDNSYWALSSIEVHTFWACEVVDGFPGLASGKQVAFAWLLWHLCLLPTLEQCEAVLRCARNTFLWGSSLDDVCVAVKRRRFNSMYSAFGGIRLWCTHCCGVLVWHCAFFPRELFCLAVVVFFCRDYSIYALKHFCTRELFVYCFLERGIFAQSGLFALPRVPHSFAPLICQVLIYKFDVLLVVFLTKFVLSRALAPKVYESLHAEDWNL